VSQAARLSEDSAPAHLARDTVQLLQR